MAAYPSTVSPDLIQAAMQRNRVEIATMAPEPTIDERLRETYDMIVRCNIILNALEGSPQPPEPEAPEGIVQSSARCMEAARGLRERLDLLAQRLGRL